MGKSKKNQLIYSTDVETTTTYTASREKFGTTFCQLIYIHSSLYYLSLCLAIFIDSSISIPTSISRLITILDKYHGV